MGIKYHGRTTHWTAHRSIVHNEVHRHRSPCLPRVQASRCTLAAASLCIIGHDSLADLPCIHLVDWERYWVFMPSRQQQAVHSSTNRHHAERYSPCPHRIPRPCKNSVTPTGLHPTSTINSAMYSSVKSTGDLCQIFKATIWCRSLTI